MTWLLASVRSAAEALVALDGGADLIDLKEPAAGALGRLPEATIAAALAAVGGRRPVSATIGDVPLAPDPVHAAVERMAALGVDIVKIGAFAGDAAATLAALRPLARDGIRMVAVLFADRPFDPALLETCAAAGFVGVMLDTADKASGPLTRHLPLSSLAAFIRGARERGMIVGLAGSLGVADVPILLPLAPDYLGFRSALAAGRRDGPIDAAALGRLRALLAVAAAQPPLARLSAKSSATATAGAEVATRAATS
jgi:(5-formylfuran-3-yl)methyl phosphate synthase